MKPSKRPYITKILYKSVLFRIIIAIRISNKKNFGKMDLRTSKKLRQRCAKPCESTLDRNKNSPLAHLSLIKSVKYSQTYVQRPPLGPQNSGRF